LLGLMKEKHLKPAAAIHSASHAWMNRFALSPDLRTECKAAEKEYTDGESRRKRPARYVCCQTVINPLMSWHRLIFYDASRKGSVSAQAFDHSEYVAPMDHLKFTEQHRRWRGFATGAR
jgi:DEAD/DEAH box helicase domain-containing protein